MTVEARPIRIRPSKPQFDIISSFAKINLFLAGQGAGKSHCAGIVSYCHIINYPKCYGFIAANTHMQLTDSTLNRVFKVWEEFGIFEYDPKTGEGHYVIDKRPPAHFNTEGHNFKDYRNKIAFLWGQIVFVGSLDNYKAHDGKEFAWAILDETKDTKEEAVKEVILGRMRQSGMKNDKGEDWNPLYIMTSPAKVQWINEMFYLDEYEKEITTSIYSETDYFKKINKVGDFITISSAYHNKANLPDNYISDNKKRYHSSLVDMLIYGNPFSKSGGEFYKCFEREKHIKTIAYDSSKALHFSFDFNVAPYMTCCVYQVHQVQNLTLVAQIDEICLKSPKNSTPSVCREIVKRYGNHKSGTFIYGDPNGNNRDTRSEVDINDFVIIMRDLKLMFPKDKVLNKAPSISMRGNFINSIFEKNYGNIHIVIAEHCKNTIADLDYLKEDSEGKKLKSKIKDKETGQMYEQYGHCTDAKDYFICAYFISELERFIKGK